MKRTFSIAVLALAATLATPAALAQTTPAPAPTTAPHNDDIGADGLKHRGDGTVDDDQPGAGEVENERPGDRQRRGGRDKTTPAATGSAVADKSSSDVARVRDRSGGRERVKTERRERVETERPGHDAVGHEAGEHGGGDDRGGHGRGGRG